MAAPSSLLSGLPNETLKHVVSFVDSKEALRLAELNSSFRQALAFSTLHDPAPLFKRNAWYGGRDETSNTPRRSVWIPALFPHRTHSIVLTCKWRDQGFGNRKGALFVVAVPVDNDPNEDTLSSMDNGTVVYESPVAPHEEESLRISFAYSPSKAYYLFYRVGGGGGHQLRVSNLMMHTIIHDCNDDNNKWILNHYNTLDSQGFLQTDNVFSLGMLRVVATIAQEDNTANTTSQLTRFLGDSDFDTSPASMKALEEMASALLEQQSQKRAHAPLQQNRNRGVGRVQLEAIPVQDFGLGQGFRFDVPPVPVGGNNPEPVGGIIPDGVPFDQGGFMFGPFAVPGPFADVAPPVQRDNDAPPPNRDAAPPHAPPEIHAGFHGFGMQVPANDGPQQARPPDVQVLGPFQFDVAGGMVGGGELPAGMNELINVARGVAENYFAGQRNGDAEPEVNNDVDDMGE